MRIIILVNYILKEYQKINYPTLWDGHPARPPSLAGKMPAPQKIVENLNIIVDNIIMLSSYQL